MNHFYVRDEESAKRCRASRDSQESITVSGVDTMDGKVKTYMGIVQSVEDYGPSSAPGRRWRITLSSNQAADIFKTGHKGSKQASTP